MTPKEKAEQLFKKMYAVHSNSASDITLHFAKECALIAVDEMIVLIGEIAHTSDEYYLNRNELLEIKQEIEKL
jgi:erythromycin esterase-like protein